VGKRDKNVSSERERGGERERERRREREREDQSDFTTLADGAILLHGAFYVSGKLWSFLLPLLLLSNYVSLLFVLNVLSFHMQLGSLFRKL